MTVYAPTTTDDFESYVMLPKNADKRLELIGGEVVEVPSNNYVSKIAGWILTLINMYLLENDIGHTVGEAAGFQIGTDRYAPDVAFLSYEKQEVISDQGYNPVPPDLAVEIISDGNQAEMRHLRIKVAAYNAVGTVVWVVDPTEELIDVHATRLYIPIAKARGIEAEFDKTAE